MLLSCGGGIAIEDKILVSPEKIDAALSLASYDIDVNTECAWTAEVQGEGGAEASWVTLSKSKGTGATKLTVRIFENKYKDVRRATVVFETAGGARASVQIAQAGKEAGEDMTKVDLRLGSYNIRMSTISETDSRNSWANRKDRLLTSIRENDFDVFGAQEVSTESQTWMRSNLGDTYEIWVFSPYSQGGTGDRAQAILFKKSLFTISDKHFFWASNTPETMSKNDTGSSGDFSRGGHCCILTHKETGTRLFFMNTHACLNAEPNATFAPVYLDMERKYNVEGLPSFFVGDLNARPGSAAVTTYNTYWKDAYDMAVTRTGAAMSYNGYTNAGGKSRIDFLFYRGSGITVNEFRINNTLYDSLYPSDHFPVWGDVEIRK